MSCTNCTCEKCQRRRDQRAATFAQMASKAAELRAKGMTISRIGIAIGTSHATVCKLLKGAKQCTP